MDTILDRLNSDAELFLAAILARPYREGAVTGPGDLQFRNCVEDLQHQAGDHFIDFLPLLLDPIKGPHPHPGGRDDSYNGYQAYQSERGTVPEHQNQIQE